MQESKEPIERPDLFSSYLRERLEDHRMPVDADGWEGVEATLRHRTMRKRWLIAAGAVAAILTGLVCLLPFHSETQEVPRVAEQPATVAPLAVESDDSSPVEQPQTASPVAIQPVTRSRMLATVTLPEEEATVAKETVSGIPVSNGAMPEEEAPAEERETNLPAAKKRKADAPAAENSYKAVADTYRRSSSRSNNRSEWLLAAGFGTGSSVDMSIGFGNDHAYDNPQNSPSGQNPEYSFNSDAENEPIWSNTGIDKNPQPEQFSDVTYHLPLSFGMTVRKNLTARLAVESGLIYTYLRTSYSGGNQVTRKAEYRYHYIGIPLNMVAYLVNRQQWNIYLSGGVMAEKGIRGAWEGTYTNITTQVYHQNGTFSISGLQWSINASLGISYRLQRQWSLYAEPRFSYFFDNNQPETARTNHPVSIGIGGGIRFEF